MRYTDEGNLRFVGNTRTSTSTQGVYRQEFDSGKWAVTLTNTEPGLGYLGYNVEALSYDFENCKLCTGNISASNVDVCGNISTSCVNVSDTIITQCLESCCGLGFECGCISNGPSEIRLYGRPDCSGPDDGCLVIADNYLCYCTSNGNASIAVDSDGVRFYGPISADGSCLYVEDYLIANCLYADTSCQCHFIYKIRKNGIDSFTNSGILDIGTVGAAVNVNGSNYVANDSGVMALPNMATSVTLNNITYNASNAGNINLGTISATVDLNSNNSLLITNCIFSTNPVGSIALGYNSRITGVMPSGNTAIGKDSMASGTGATAIGQNSTAYDYAVAVGCGTCAEYLTAAFGIRAKACGSGNMAIGTDVVMCSNTSKIVGIVQGSKLYTSNTYSNFGSLQLAIKCNTLECDLYNVLESIILNNTDNVYEANRQNKDYLLLDKAIYRCGTDLRILGVGDIDTPIKYSSTSIDIGTRMTIHKDCESPIALCCPGTANYEVWNISY